MKKVNTGRVLYGHYCPYCGNEIPTSVLYDRKQRTMKCSYCRIVFPKYEIVKERKK